MKNKGTWSIEDYESLSWHDTHVHGLWFENFDSKNGSSDLILDIDFILKWEEKKEGFIFTVGQAELRFHHIFALKMNLDYKTPTAGMTPFMIEGIHRKRLEFKTGYVSYKWLLPVNWPSGSIEFEAPNFTQKLIGVPVLQNAQCLESNLRKKRNAF
jgi:hypothetical protein